MIFSLYSELPVLFQRETKVLQWEKLAEFEPGTVFSLEIQLINSFEMFVGP